MDTTPQVKNGFTRIANQILDDICQVNLSSYQSRVLHFIWRKTYGYGKKQDWISVSQIVEGTGIKKSHVSRTKKELLLRKIVTSSGNKIGFQKDSRLWQELPNQVTIKNSYQSRPEVTNSGQKVTNLGQKLPVQGNTKDNIQKKITKDNIQKKYARLKDLDDFVLQEIADKYKVPLPFVRSKLDDMTNWLEAKGKRYKNYKSALMNWVKQDAIKIISSEKRNANKQGIDARNI
jgi:phage replication O-like protein O